MKCFTRLDKNKQQLYRFLLTIWTCFLIIWTKTMVSCVGLRLTFRSKVYTSKRAFGITDHSGYIQVLWFSWPLILTRLVNQIRLIIPGRNVAISTPWERCSGLVAKNERGIGPIVGKALLCNKFEDLVLDWVYLDIFWWRQLPVRFGCLKGDAMTLWYKGRFTHRSLHHFATRSWWRRSNLLPGKVQSFCGSRPSKGKQKSERCTTGEEKKMDSLFSQETELMGSII